MSNSPTAHPSVPDTVWLARGPGGGPSAADDVRRTLRRLEADGVVHSHLDLPAHDDTADHVFEARWQVRGTVTVRARLALTTPQDPGTGQEWLLAAEAEQRWDDAWPSPVTMFWPDTPDAAWDRDPLTELRVRGINPLPADEKDIRRVLGRGARDPWHIHVVVHEAMTPDERGLRPLAEHLPPGLRHRVVEHRAAPQQLRPVNWALREFGVQVPRGGAVVLPGSPAPSGHDPEDYSVRSVFLDGSAPADLIDRVSAFDALPRPLPPGAADALTALREHWHLVTVEEDLEHQRRLVTLYSEALEAMTTSRDLYREAAERAHEALTALQESAVVPAPGRREPGAPVSSPLKQLTRTFERLKGTAR
ncbi:hypothetical protein [Streptomyces fructofermentans]|uniref:Uncharacterized protein n=1 Tax=Streptomyces fructofermentans TaxID=152141 RepID=A0A918KQW8_9ACTN|nr:hypothetical protein [Streptomyces fructofermentans]GGX70063.1 hypothetical protein GCM10010515_42150 [Streptomyces fructofermentans]